LQPIIEINEIINKKCVELRNVQIDAKVVSPSNPTNSQQNSGPPITFYECVFKLNKEGMVNFIEA